MYTVDTTTASCALMQSAVAGQAEAAWRQLMALVEDGDQGPIWSEIWGI